MIGRMKKLGNIFKKVRNSLRKTTKIKGKRLLKTKNLRKKRKIRTRSLQNTKRRKTKNQRRRNNQ